MIIKRLALLDALNLAKFGVAVTSHMEQMKNIQFTKDDLIAFNGKVCVHIPFETDFEASVNYLDLYKIVSNMDADDISIEVNENELSLKSDDTTAGLLMMDTEDIIKQINVVVDQMPKEWKKLPNDFLTGVSLCYPVADTDISKQALSCLYASNNQIICSDNKRAAIYEMESSIEDTFLVRAALMADLSKFSIVGFGVSDSWVYFTTEKEEIISIGRVLGKGLDMYNKLINEFKNKKRSKVPDGFSKIVSSASVMEGNEENSGMSIFIKNGKMVCGTSNERGWVEKNVDVESNKNIGMHVNPKFLKHVADLPELRMCIGEDRSLFEFGSFSYIVMHYSK